MIGLLIRAICIVLYSAVCGYFVKSAIENFKQEKYFFFGGDLTFVIVWVTSLIQFIWEW